MWELAYWCLKALLGFVFSGSQKTEVYRTSGVKGLDKETLAGINDLPKFVLIIGLVFLTGCSPWSWLGRNTTEQIALVEAGGFIEVAQDEPIEVKYEKNNVDVIELHNMACARVVPKKVYDNLRTKFEGNAVLGLTPSIEICESSVEAGVIVMAEAVPTCIITSKKKITVIATTVGGRIIKSQRRLTGMIAMSKTTYEQLTNGN